MRREVRAMCDRGAASCSINPCPCTLFSRSSVTIIKSSIVVGSVSSVSVCFVIQFSHAKSQYAAFHRKPTTIPCKIVEKSSSTTGRMQARGPRVALQSARASPDLYTLQICSQAVWRDCVQTPLGKTPNPPRRTPRTLSICERLTPQ
jgi:hypothetical protein